MKQLSELTRKQLEDIVRQDPRRPLAGPAHRRPRSRPVVGQRDDRVGLGRAGGRRAQARPGPADLTAEPGGLPRSRRRRRCGRPWRRSSARSRQPVAASGPEEGPPAWRTGRSSTPWTTIPSRPPMRRGWTSPTRTSWPAGPWAASRWSGRGRRGQPGRRRGCRRALTVRVAPSADARIGRTDPDSGHRPASHVVRDWRSSLWRLPTS